jgi:membrane protein DedA with SNARE-associated domain
MHARRVRLIDAGDRFFAKHGNKAVFLGRWVALVRISAAWMAGISGMRFSHFFIYNALGGITWATTVGLVAYFAGDAAAKAINQFGVFAAIAIGVMIVGLVVFVRVRERRAHSG